MTTRFLAAVVAWTVAAFSAARGGRQPLQFERAPSGTGLATALPRRIKRAARRWEAARVGLEARDFSDWAPELDAALETLPEPPNCPRAVLHLLLEPRPDTPKRIVLLTDHEMPVALMPLRLTPWGWEPLTTWIVPGPPFPVRDGELARVLRAVGLPMKIAWWRCPSSAPRGAGIVVTDEPTYGIDFAADYSAHWHHKHVESVKKALRRSASFRFDVDPPGGARWTIRNSGQKWAIPVGITEDRVAAAEWFELRGRHHTAVLFDGERATAGTAMFVDGGDLVGHTMFRDPEYDKCGVGASLLHHALDWASGQSFARLDFGGGGKWKSDWAPEAGRKFECRVTPLYAAVAAWLRNLRRPSEAAAP